MVPEDVVDARHELLKLRKAELDLQTSAIEPVAALPLYLRLHW